MAVFETFPHLRGWKKGTKLIELFLFSVPLWMKWGVFTMKTVLRRDSCCSQPLFPMIPSNEVIKELIDWLLLTKNPHCKRMPNIKSSQRFCTCFWGCCLTSFWLLYPVWSMVLVFLPTFTNKNQPNVVKYTIHGSLVGDFNSLEKYDRQIGSFSQIGVKIKNMWNPWKSTTVFKMVQPPFSKWWFLLEDDQPD